MAVLKATRSVQYPVIAEFIFNFNDTAIDSVTGVSTTWGSDYLTDITFDAIPIPVGATICGGEVVVQTAGVGPTAYTLSVGIAGSTTALASAVDLTAAAGTRTALTLTTTPFLSNSGQNIRLTVNATVANATAGKARVRVMYTLDGKANEVSVV